MLWPTLVVIARVLGEPDLPVPDVEDHAVFLLKRHGVMVGCAPDGGLGDAGVDAPSDAGVDAGVASDAGTDACYVIDGDAVTMIVKPSLQFDDATGTRFAMLFVTPARPFVEVKPDPFVDLDVQTAAVTVTREIEVEDPALGEVCHDTRSVGCGGGGGGGCSPAWQPPGVGGTDTDPGDAGVPYEMIGPYQVLRVQPADRAELVAWLDQAGFAYATEDVDAVVPYIMRGYHVVAVRLALAQPSEIPLSLTWAGSELRLPLALAASQDPDATLTVYVGADGTYTFPGAEMIYSGALSYADGGYVTRQELTIGAIASPDEDPVAARQTPDLYYRKTIEQIVEVHVPVLVDCYSDDEDKDDGGCCNTRREVRVDWMLVAGAVTFIVRRRRRR